MLSIRPVAIFGVSLLLFLTACGYHTAGSPTHLPPDIGTIDVPVFQTNVVNYHTEVAFTNAVVRELTSRTRDRVTESNRPHVSDATLRGKILTETVTPLTYNAQTGQSSSFLITITASAVLKDASGKVLYSNDNFRFHSQYQETADLSSFIQEDSPAVQRIARDFAQSLVSDLMESF